MKTVTLSRRPASVLNALRLLVFCLAVELLGFAFSGDYSVGSVVSVLIGAVLTFYVLRQIHAGANWARYVIAVLIGLGVLSLVSVFRQEYAENPGATVVDALSTIISLIAVILLFTKDSNAWFRQHAVGTRV